MKNSRNVIVFCETIEGNLAAVSKELLGCGRRLADSLGQDLWSVVMGDRVSHLTSEIIAFGADSVFVMEDPALRVYRTEIFCRLMVGMIQEKSPGIVLLGHTSVGLDLAPRLAFELETAIVLDCVDLSVESDTNHLIMVKPVYGGKALGRFSTERYPQMATIRSKSFAPIDKDESRHGTVIRLAVEINESHARTKVVGRVREQGEGLKLEDAEVIVAGGRGIGSAEGFEQLRELTEKVKNAALGASRPPCDEGWMPATAQVGLSGKIVAPRVYVAVGISGASQHIAGCSASDVIVAINKDANANIFKEAQFGVVGDWKVVFPAFVKKLHDLLGN